MTDNTVFSLNTPQDSLTELIRQGARDLIAQAVETELQQLLVQHQNVMVDGKQAIVRNGFLPERTLQTGVGDVEVQIPKVRDRSGNGVKFNSNLLPPYLKGISTGDMLTAIESLLGKDAKGLSANSICRLKERWYAEYELWRKRDLGRRRYVYVWADGIYCHIRMDDKLCLLVDDTGRKEVLGVLDGHRESEASWTELIEQLRAQGLQLAPKLAIGDGALGFWKAVAKCWPQTAQQRCWVHKAADVLNKVPKSVQPRIKEALQDIWMAETRDDAYHAFSTFQKRFEAKHPKATDCLVKDKAEMLAFYYYPADHWVHIRTTNPIESMFATVRLRTNEAKNCGNRKTTLMMAYKLMRSAETKWRRLRGFALLADTVKKDVRFIDGVKEMESHQQATA
ncbi:IS256 family transposase [Vibrio sp. CUB2]|uniref:IS256 family transposase n=1 Tax=Vibrio sp. CUB2 TaxID=2315233 RepID=UPI00076A4D93|nr:IS256 family transposase [Vibrio sp. CUB2]